MRSLLVALLIVVSSAACAQTEWEMVEPGGDTRCAFDTPYRFFFRPGADADRLLVYFQGGGACWNWVSCAGMFDPSVEPDELREYRGIFDASNPENPFRDYAVLFVPYCTGDVHVGAAEATYGEDVGAQPVAHGGAANVDAALAWAAERVERPERVVVAGASAGAYGALFHAPRVATQYPEAAVVTIGDSGVPLLHAYGPILEGWGAGPALRAAWGAPADAPLTLERASVEAAAPPNMEAVVQITSDRDAVQSAFYLISGSPGWRAATYALLDRAERASPTVRSFVVAGADHGLMRTDAFYTYAADGVSLADWVGRVIAGEPVASVRCVACAVE